MAQPADESKAMESEVFKSRYRKIKVVGKGSFGEAVLVRSKADGKRYIAKAIESSAMTPKEKRDVQNEIKILAAVNHPNIIRYHEHFEDGTLIFIIMEYADGGDLNSRIKDQKKKGTDPLQLFDPKLAMFWFLQIAMALKFLHDNHILHRDLKTANVFLTSRNIVKLGDFGISTVLQNTMACAKTVCGTPYYFSPELCQSKPYNNKSDVWALGVVFYETLTLCRPFNAKSLKELLKKILVGQYEPLPGSIPSEMRTLCASLLQVNPVQRPSINRILESGFVQDSLKSYSADLEQQTAKEKEEYEAKPPAAAQVAQAPARKSAVAQAPPPAQEKQMSEREQMAMMRNMGREGLKAMLNNPKLQEEAKSATAVANSGTQGTTQEEQGHPDVDDDGESIAAKQEMIRQTKEVVGKSKLGGHEEEFGDGPSSDVAPQEEHITMANGQTVPAKTVRGLLEKEMGPVLVTKAVEYVSDLMSCGQPTNAEIQRELNALIGLRFAHNSNAIAKLAVWESKSQ